jgi:pimeloyl-ACP methyl ester carboxylesterase
MSDSVRRRKWPWVVLFSAIALVVVFYVGGGWYFSGQVYEGALKVVPYDPADLQQGTVTTIDSTREPPTVTILPEESERDETKFDDAVMGLAIGESLVVVGPATRSPDGSQTREIIEVVGDTPEPGATYGLTRDVWLNPEQAGYDPEYASVTTLAGKEYPVWVIKGKGAKRWAVLVHGKGAARSEMLRMARPLNDAGYNLIIMTWTGDVGAPQYEDGMYTYGREEWPEVEAAVQYALDEGAQRLLLGAASTGGAVAMGFLDRGTLGGKVDGLILDAPVASFEDLIDEAAEFRTLPIGGLAIPESLEDVTKWIVAFRYGVDYSAVDYSGREGLIEVPLLTFQGSADETVGKPVNDRFMLEGSGRAGEYVVTEGADHLLSWNYDPEAFEEKVTEFVKGLAE